jgi:DNA processing protein
MRNKEYSWFMLSNAPGFGAKSIHYIYDILQQNNLTINDLFNLDANELQQFFPEIGRGRFSRASFSCFSSLDDDRLYNNFENLKADSVYTIGLDDERYPESVLQKLQNNAPPVLYCKGYLPLLNAKGVAIVGARNVGDFEITVTKSIAQKLSEHGINVTSGYAKGVDTSAHLGALEAHGTTTMILSFGTNHISIKRELKTLNWEKNSLFITQFAPHEKFSGQNAMARNKLVCAMSKAIVVIRSGPEKDSNGRLSGTFDAGKSALKMGIPVFVLSPQLLQPALQGNIDLINLGGIEFSNGVDIINFLEKHPQEESTNVNSKENKISTGALKTKKTKSPDSYQTRLPF